MRPPSSSDLYIDDSKTHPKQPNTAEEEEAKWHDVDITPDDDEYVHISSPTDADRDAEWEVVAPHRAINAPPTAAKGVWPGGGGLRAGAVGERESERNSDGNAYWMWREGVGVEEREMRGRKVGERRNRGRLWGA